MPKGLDTAGPEQEGPRGGTRRGILIGAGTVLGLGALGVGLSRLDLGGDGGDRPTPSPTSDPATEPDAGCVAERDFPERFPEELEVLDDVPLQNEPLGTPFTQVSVQDVAVLSGADERERLVVTQHGATAQIQLIPLDGDSENVVHDVEVGVNPGVAVGAGVCWFVTREEGRVLSVGPDPEALQDHGRVSEEATSLYSPVIGPGDAVYGGSYPIGAVWRLNPEAGEIVVGPRIGDNQYVRSVALLEGRLFVGTGGNEPALHEIDPSTLESVAVHQVPGVRSGGSVSRLVPMPGGAMIVYRDEEDGGSDGIFFEADSGAFGAELSPGASSRSFTVDPETQQLVYVASDRVQRLDPRTYRVSDAGLSAMPNPTAVVTRSSGIVVGVSPAEDGAESILLAPLTSSGDPETFGLAASAHDLTAVIPLESTAQLAIGGYQADGVVIVDASGTETSRTAEDSGIQQVEGGIESDAGAVLVGSYGEGRLHEVTSVEGEAVAASVEIADLGDEFQQARPVAWAHSDQRFAVGTVPEQGRVGGLLHLLSRDGDTITPSGVIEDPADGRSIVGVALIGEDEAVLTTSVAGGYGAEAGAERAEILRMTLPDGEVLWSTPVESLDAYTPQIQNGVVFAGTTDGVLALDLESGELLAHAVIGRAADRAGYSSARIEPWHVQGRFLHVARGRLSVVDLVDGTVAAGSDGVGSPLALMGQQVYAASGAELVRFTPPEDPAVASC